MIASTAIATPFSLSYHFVPDSPGAYAPVITGTFDAVRNGDFVETISNLHMSIDGVALAPVASLQFFISGRNDALSDWSLPPVVSFTLLSNNFGISDSDIAAGDLSGDFFFVFVPADPNVGAFAYSGSLGIADADSLPDLGAWKLTDLSVPSGVPDGGSTAMTVLFALVAMGLLRRSRQL